MNTATLTRIQLHKQSKTLELQFGEQSYSLSAEYLRVYSPSAEVRGHSPSQAVLQTGKINVAIDDIKTVGNYALQLYFSDGHDSGIYSFSYLHELATQYEPYWQDYLQRLEQAKASRDPDLQVVRIGL
ncbi:DUF971 domain-containing protein [Dasania sp. GY-MA-18]|uniref:DUF971 domain-containing protein n=1 Tax=Dasania phycosphaerae TaxID=2950436 RepID=A0A9J6RHZ7_9GAMM|nr:MULTISPECIES: DUF971 domain-containing protein [Dasania]MCR8921541.1 DUF971 domain-containing protein [Dasania sp. GY-MA-18]MCZ0863969.1 DUF971 domain-containing protein [Dasania phycosphaerae]MCZ0867697.1 DUF971 domain-containing protein [Dasania phycosphaerae]